MGECMKYNRELWEKIIELGKKMEPERKGIANKLTNPSDVHFVRSAPTDTDTILGTMDFFGASSTWMRQTAFDLTGPKYRVFDWLAMCVMGRNAVDDESRRQNENALKVLVHSYFKVCGDVEKFIKDLRTWDYEVDTSWESVDIEGKG